MHNGIIENYMHLREWLSKKGVQFVSDTDTEVIVHLIDYYLKDDLKDAVAQAISKLKGKLCAGRCKRTLSAGNCRGSQRQPACCGRGRKRNLIASDIPALLEYTRCVFPE